MKRKNVLILLGFLVIMLVATESATQYFASEVQYDEALGSPLLNFGKTTVYAPLFFVWWYQFASDAPEAFQRAFSVFTVVLICEFAILVFFKVMMRKKVMTSHGTARWATRKEIEKAKLLGEKVGGQWVNNGIFLGKTDKGEYLRDDGGQHAIMIAPTGSGKGVGVVIPTLLTYPHSTVIMDIKGENWEKTSGYRKKKLSNVVIKFKPTDAVGSAKYNPLDEIRIETPYEIKDIQNIVNILIDPIGKGDLDHWQQSAHTLLTGIILHLKYAMRNACLADVVSFFSNPERPIIDGLNEMLTFTHTKSNTLFKKIYKRDKISNPYTHPKVIEYAQEMLTKPEEEFGSIASTALKVLAIYRDPILAENTSRSDFLVRDLMNHVKPVSLYLVFPPSDIDRMTPVCRMIIELILRLSLEDLTYKHKLLLLLDEFPSLGRLDTFERALAYIRGYGIRALLIAQSINQLNKIYTVNNSIIDNCHIRIFHTPNELETPKYISGMLGQSTIMVKSKSYNSAAILDRSYSMQETKRELMTPDEVQRMPENDEIIFVAGFPPIYARKIQYYKDSNFQPRSKIPYPRKSDFFTHRRLTPYKNLLKRGAVYKTSGKFLLKKCVVAPNKTPLFIVKKAL